jgi:hypothetical protein
MIHPEYMYREARLRFYYTFNVLISAGKLQTPYCHLSNFIYCGSASLSLSQIRLKISLLTLCIHIHFPKDLVTPKHVII